MTNISALTGSQTKNGYGVPSAIYEAVADASKKTGISFSYLMTKAQTESNFDSAVQSSSSSATGLYQFVENTWLDMIDRHGDKYGLGNLASKITRRSDGGYSVEGGYQARKEILALRNDADLSAYMAAEYAGENASYLEQRLGREASDTDLYMAHFLGAGGASKFLSAMDKNENNSAADVLPRAARANRSIFYNRDGSEKTLGEVYATFENKFSSGRSYYAMNDGTGETGETSVATATSAKSLSGYSTVADVSGLSTYVEGEDIGAEVIAEVSDVAQMKF